MKQTYFLITLIAVFKILYFIPLITTNQKSKINNLLSYQGLLLYAQSQSLIHLPMGVSWSYNTQNL